MTIKSVNLLFVCLVCLPVLRAQHTFSIVAVDTLTGEIGSAGASCLDDLQFPGSGGAILISDILPGRGAIHTQSYWLEANQDNARLKMQEGLTPAEILLWLKQNDPEGAFGAQKRQYGIIDFDSQGHPRSAAFTGNSCMNWRGHRTGATYAIQGNILMGPEILDSMEARFLAASGALSHRLMEALQGANVAGADLRCLDNETSSLSAFLRVASPGDPDGQYGLDLNVPSLPAGMEPIDSLQHLYDQSIALGMQEARFEADLASLSPNPAKGALHVTLFGRSGRIEWFDMAGRMVYSDVLAAGDNRFSPTLPAGLYFVRLVLRDKTFITRRVFWEP